MSQAARWPAKRKSHDTLADPGAAGLQPAASGGQAAGPTCQPQLLRLQAGAHSLIGLSSSKQEQQDAFISISISTHLRPATLGGGAPSPQQQQQQQAPLPPPPLPPLHLLAVFDGHSSATVSNLCVEQLPALLTQLLEAEAAACAPHALDDAAMQRVLEQAFEQLNARVPALDNSGSTATVALLTPTRVHLAWVGDSRAVLIGRDGSVLAATTEHRATREDEQERVIAAGGTILNNSGLRVMGVLQCTRAIGDRDLQPYGVIATPDVLSVPRSSQQEFLVLATDGLWDVLSNAEVYQYAHKTLTKVEERCARQPNGSGACCGCQAAGVAARALAQCARKQRGSRDDITVLLVHLAAACSCTKLPAVLSSSSHLKAASSSLCGAPASSSIAQDITALLSSSSAVPPAVHTQLHSSPAALLDAGLSGGGAAAPPPAQLDAVQPWQDSQLRLLAAKPRPQSDQAAAAPAAAAAAAAAAADDAAEQRQQRQQAVRQCLRNGASPKAGLLVQPSVAPASAFSPRRQLAARGGAGAGGGGGSSTVQQQPHPAGAAAPAAAALQPQHPHFNLAAAHLSDLALSSPFAAVLSDVGAEVDVALAVHAAAATAAVKSAPPLGGHDSAGLLAKRSVSAALQASRSCGSLGGGPLGSAELPVVVLT